MGFTVSNWAVFQWSYLSPTCNRCKRLGCGALKIFAMHRRLFVRSSLKQKDLEILRGIENEVYPKNHCFDLFFFLGWFYYGFDPMGIHHHFSPPFGTICLNFSKHQTSKSELATEILGGGQVLHWKLYSNRPWLWITDSTRWSMLRFALLWKASDKRIRTGHFSHLFPIYFNWVGFCKFANKNTCSMLQSQSHSFFSPKHTRCMLPVCSIWSCFDLRILQLQLPGDSIRERFIPDR